MSIDWPEPGIGSGEAVFVDRSASWLDFLKTRYKKDLDNISREFKIREDLKYCSLYIKYSDILAYGKKGTEFVDRLEKNPRIVLQEIADCIYSNHLVFKKERSGEVFVRITNVPRKRSVHSLGEKDVGSLVSVEGFIRKSTQKGSRCILASFRCVAGHRIRIPQTIGLLKEPDRCSADGCKNKKFEFIEIDSDFRDNQKLRIQESPEGLSGGDQPKSIDVDCLNDLCNIANPGDRVIVTGILKRINKSYTSHKSSGFNLYIECNSIEITQQDYTDLTYSDKDIETIEALSKDPNIFTKIATSIAPSVYGLEEVKLGLALQQFGGVPHIIRNNRKRGDTHVLLSGDPGIAKTQLLDFIYQLAPRAVYTGGKGSSAAGLTGAAVKDEFGEGSWTIEAGALVLADNGICIVDEFGRMEKHDREAMHSCLEGRQEVHIAKAGVTTTMHSRCALLAAENPKYGRYDDALSLAENLNIDPALFSRFDLVFILIDHPEPELDSAIAGHMIDSLTDDSVSEPDIGIDLYRKYIAYARKIEPVLSTEAGAILKEYYPAVRSVARDRTKAAMPITARQLEAAVRISEACARVRLSSVVSAEDTKRALKILDKCLRSLAYDPTTGMYDVDALMTGSPRCLKDLSKAIILMAKSMDNGESIAEYDLVSRMTKQGYDELTVRSRIEVLKTNGIFFAPRIGKLKYIEEKS